MLFGPAYGLDPISDTDFLIDVIDVGLHGMRTQVYPLGDVLVGVAAC